MKRRLLIVAVFLLAGAVVNVAVAWGFAAWNPKIVDFYRWTAQPQGAESLWVAQINSPGSTRLLFAKGVFAPPEPTDIVVAEEDLLPSWAVLAGRGINAVESGGHWEKIWDARGWPARSMYCEFEMAQRGAFATSIELGGIELAPSRHLPPARTRSDWRALPLRPLWPGFAVNTLLYAVVLWLLIPGPFALRRFIRVRRGLCPACAYPRGESDVCSECGKAMPVRARVAT